MIPLSLSKPITKEERQESIHYSCRYDTSIRHSGESADIINPFQQ